MTYDAIIIGAGVNGLVTANYLAKAGLKTLVVERRKTLGGIASTEEIAPGFRCSSVAHSTGPLLPNVFNDLQLTRHGLESLEPAVRLTALNPDGPSVSIHRDPKRTIASIATLSKTDAEAYPEFAKSFARIGRVLAPLLTMVPPSLDDPTPGEVFNLGKLGLAFRGLGKKDAYRLLRWGPMAVADLAAEWFDTELLRAAVAARGIFGAFAGPWSAGTSLGLLWQAAINGSPLLPATFVRGGMGTVARALGAAGESIGIEIRTNTNVERIESGENGLRVVLPSGDSLSARAVVSSADPKTTFLKLVDPVQLDPTFIMRMQNYRSLGSVAKVNLALSALPKFTGIDHEEQLTGRIHIGPEIDYLERAFDAGKYGNYSTNPYLDVTIPSLLDPSLAPSGAHVMSIHVQFAPYKLARGDWNTRRESLGDTVINVLSQYAPNTRELIVSRQVLTPFDLEQQYGLAGGHIMHGEQSLDQFFTFRPLIGWAQYRTPIPGLYLCGAGTHPGGGITGGPGANASRGIIKDLKRR